MALLSDRYSLVVASCLALATACAPQLETARKPLSTCARGLVAHGYVSEDETAKADGYCHQYAEAQIDCAKREYDANRKVPGATFGVSTACGGTSVPAEKSVASEPAPAPAPAATPAPAPAPAEPAKPAASIQAAEAAAAPPTATPEPPKPPEPKAPDVVSVVAAEEDLSTFSKLLEEAGLAETIAQSGTVTLLVPLNAAMAKFPQLGTKKEWLKKVLANHIVLGAVSAIDAPEPPVKPQQLKTLGGKVLSMRVKSGAVYIGRAKIVRADIPGSNGVVEVIDAVLLP